MTKQWPGGTIGNVPLFNASNNASTAGLDHCSSTRAMYQVIHFTPEEDREVGVYFYLWEAQAEARKAPRYAIYLGQWDGEDFTHGRRVEFCDPYDGDDDRAKQGLGLPNASEAEEGR